MTVAELIERLQSLPQDMKVVVHGYEDGYHMVHHLEQIQVVNTPNVPWYSGDYQTPYYEEGDEWKGDSETVAEIVGKKSANWQGGDE